MAKQFITYSQERIKGKDHMGLGPGQQNVGSSKNWIFSLFKMLETKFRASKNSDRLILILNTIGKVTIIKYSLIIIKWSLLLKIGITWNNDLSWV